MNRLSSRQRPRAFLIEWEIFDLLPGTPVIVPGEKRPRAFGPNEIAVYGALKRLMGSRERKNFKMETIAARSGCSAKTVQRTLPVLAACHLLEIRERTHEFGGRAANEYALLDVEEAVKKLGMGGRKPEQEAPESPAAAGGPAASQSGTPGQVVQAPGQSDPSPGQAVQARPANPSGHIERSGGIGSSSESSPPQSPPLGGKAAEPAKSEPAGTAGAEALTLPLEDGSPRVSPEWVVGRWNELAQAVSGRPPKPGTEGPRLPLVRELTASRREKLLLRIAEHPRQEHWRAVLERLSADPWATGCKRARNGFFHATLDWLCRNDRNFARVLEWPPPRDPAGETRREGRSFEDDDAQFLSQRRNAR